MMPIKITEKVINYHQPSKMTSPHSQLPTRLYKMLRNMTSKFSLRGLFKRKPKIVIPKKDADLQMLDDFTIHMNATTFAPPPRDN